MAVSSDIITKLRDELHYTRNLCEHSVSPGACATAYCYKIHTLQTTGKEIFSSLELLLPMSQHEYYFFSPLQDARRLCCMDCELSRFYFRMAEQYVKTLEKSL